jgi:asparagine synthase (glutamine-hydrolysing)
MHYSIAEINEPVHRVCAAFLDGNPKLDQQEPSSPKCNGTARSRFEYGENLLIGGYVAESRESDIERGFSGYCAGPVEEYTAECSGHSAWLFRDLDERRLRHDVFAREDQITLLDEIAVTGDVRDGYRMLQSQEDAPGLRIADFECFLDKLVSTVNVISVTKSEGQLATRLASHRVGPGRIWYMYLPLGKGIAFCNDFRALLGFTTLAVDPVAYYAIIRYGSCPDPITLVKGISCVPVSHYVAFSTPDYRLMIRPYFKLDFPQSHDSDLKPAKKIIQESMRLLSHLSPSLLLSGGVDSTLLVHYLLPSNESKAFHLAFGAKDPELQFARYAAEHAHIDLDTVYMEIEDVIPAMIGCASSYMLPFADSTAMPTYHLIHHIRRDHPGIQMTIDGTGADACFSVIGDRDRLIWRLLYAQPKRVRQLESTISELAGGYGSGDIRGRVLRAFAHCAEDNIQDGIMAINFFPHDRIFRREFRKFGRDVPARIRSLANSCVAEGSCNKSFYAQTAGIDILYLLQMPAFKDYALGKDHHLDVVSPFLWRDILIEQGMLSWRCRKKKLPLKTLLMEYVPKSFVHRRKAGFIAPLRHWLADEKVSAFASNVMLSESAYIRNLIPVSRLRAMMSDVQRRRAVSDDTLQLLWAVLFTELWLRKNGL